MVVVYETAVEKADALADLQVEKADATAKLAILSAQIREQEEILNDLENEKAALDQETQFLEGEWKKMWAGLPSGPLEPDLMLDWLEARKEWGHATEQKFKIEQRREVISRQEEESKLSLLEALATSGVDVSDLSGMPLAVVLERAEEILSRNDRLREERKNLEGEVNQAKTNAARKKASLENVEQARKDWEQKWARAIADLGLDAVSSPESIAGQMDAIDEMRTIAVKINDLRHERIGKIQRDCQAFEREVGSLLPVLAPDLTTVDALEAVLKLERRLEDAKRMNELGKEKDASIRTLEQKIRTYETSLKEARETISNLKTLAGASEIAELKETIEKSERAIALKKEKTRILKVLAEEGDGLPLPEILAECEGVDLDHISAREGTVTQDLETLQRKRLEARDHRTEAQRAFESVGGDDTASKAEAMRQEAIAEMKEIASRYTHARSSAILLRWVIDRYRKEKQAPLLKSASALFSTLTGGSFSSLKVEFDEDDQPHLAGVRPDGSTVRGSQPKSGMSTGTADQLYLALRIELLSNLVFEDIRQRPALKFPLELRL